MPSFNKEGGKLSTGCNDQNPAADGNHTLHTHTHKQKTENKSRVGHRHHVKQLEYQSKRRDTKKAQSQIPARFCHQWLQSDGYQCDNKCLNTVVTMETTLIKWGTLSWDSGTATCPPFIPVWANSSIVSLFGKSAERSVNNWVIWVEQKNPTLSDSCVSHGHY